VHHSAHIPSKLFIDRDLSALEFNRRVLSEADNPRNPLFEQMKFLSIAASNLDEFFMVHAESLHEKAHIRAAARALTAGIYDALNRILLPRLKQHGIRLLRADALSAAQRKHLRARWQRDIFPLLTPISPDAANPFPHIPCRALNLCVLFDAAPEAALISLPGALPRLIRVGKAGFLPTEQLIQSEIASLFPGRRILCCAPFRITRSAAMHIDPSSGNLLQEIGHSLKQRRQGAPARLEIDKSADARLLRVLLSAFSLSEADVYPIDGPLAPDGLLREIYDLPGFEALRYAPHVPRLPDMLPGSGIFEEAARRDLLLCHPYDSFDTVVRLLQEAARDDAVLSIRQTLYRLSEASPVAHALMNAAQRGKQVTVLLELKARFDEENNIRWARRLREAGVHVIYGVNRLKTHSKITLIVRREKGGIRRYVHLGTGNYNDATACAYTDYSCITSREDIAQDASLFFNTICGRCPPPALSCLCAAPHDLRTRFLELIRREARHASCGRPAFIIAKLNALTDEEIIRALYDASCAGVHIRLIVRGMCCLRPRVKGLSEHIRVRSIVGRFLEHGRIYCFYNDGKEEIYLSSADWMPRNLDRRIELMFPVRDEALCRRLKASLRIQWADNTQSHELLPDGTYRRRTAEQGTPVSSQEQFMLGADIVPFVREQRPV